MLQWTKESTTRSQTESQSLNGKLDIFLVFLTASSSDVPAADDAAEIQCDRQASAINGSAKENAVVSTTCWTLDIVTKLLAVFVAGKGSTLSRSFIRAAYTSHAFTGPLEKPWIRPCIHVIS